MLAVDRARFPSDTVSTHFMWPRTTAFLSRWGLLESLAATGCPPIDKVQIHFGAATVHGRPEAVDGTEVEKRLVASAAMVAVFAGAGAMFWLLQLWKFIA